MKVIKKICFILCYVIGKIQYLLHKLFPKQIPLLSCYGCNNDICKHRAKKDNLICYYHTKKRKMK